MVKGELVIRLIPSYPGALGLDTAHIVEMPVTQIISDPNPIANTVLTQLSGQLGTKEKLKCLDM